MCQFTETKAQVEDTNIPWHENRKILSIIVWIMFAGLAGIVLIAHKLDIYDGIIKTIGIISLGIVAFVSLVLLAQCFKVFCAENKVHGRWRDEVMINFVHVIAELNEMYASKVEFVLHPKIEHHSSKSESSRVYYIFVNVKLLVDYVKV